MTAFFVLCSLTVGLQSCNDKVKDKIDVVAKTEFNIATAKAEIEEANKNFKALLEAGDSVGLANSYTFDATFMSAGAPAVSGRDNIQSVISGILKSGITGIDIKTIDVWGTEDLLVEDAEILLFVGSNKVAQEKAIVVWKKEDGKWKLFRDIFNSNLPAD